MGFKVRTNISEKYEEIEIIINAPKITGEVQKIEKKLLEKDIAIIKQIIGYQGNDIFVIKTEDIILFYSEEKNMYGSDYPSEGILFFGNVKIKRGCSYRNI